MFHVKHSLGDTIAAIVTPLGVGGVGMVRVSGSLSIVVAGKIIRNFPSKVESNRIYHGWVVDGGKLIDEVLYFYMRAPKSYTGEDVVEVCGHGGIVVLQRILDVIIRAGARLAERGEFTLRAFLNGKIDLAQAEAVLGLIQARTERGVEAAAAQLGGRLSREISALRERILHMLAEVEAEIDFPEDVEQINLDEIAATLFSCISEVDRLLSAANYGRILREGVRTVIVGKPNVGKSSLLNALLGEERAIVTDMPGTTRDTIEETLSIEGFPFTIVDTAGIRHPKDKAEEFGVERARREMLSSDLFLLVFDGSQPLEEDDLRLLEEAQRKNGIIVLNKLDLGCRISLNGFGKSLRVHKISALTGHGVEDLKQGMLDHILEDKVVVGEPIGIFNARQKECLLRACESLNRALSLIRSGSIDERLASDLRGAVVALGEVSGEEVSEEIIKTIFEKFCVGK